MLRRFCDDSDGSVQQLAVSALTLSQAVHGKLLSLHTDGRVRFISCSATLANPVEYMSNMFGLNTEEVEVISNDGSPSGAKDYLVWNPPAIDAMNPSLGRKSSISEASRLMRFLMKKGTRVILFCKVSWCIIVYLQNVTNLKTDPQSVRARECTLLGVKTCLYILHTGHENHQGRLEQRR